MLSFVFLMVAILTGVRWILNVVLIHISFMARDDENSFILKDLFSLNISN
jgi:hypothetical protein